MKKSKSCFVIMPFGLKKDHDGNPVNFDNIYSEIIKPAIEEIDVECLRCDEISQSGLIHKDMFNHIFHSDIAVVDISVLNPNVFYELGMRHSLKKAVTVIIKRKNTNIPFNISGLRIIEYDENDEESKVITKLQIQKFVENGIGSLKIDSPIHDSIANLSVKTKETFVTKSENFDYELGKDSTKMVGLRTGSIEKVKDFDIWVNSENTNMQMAKYYSGTISGLIRFLGAKKDITQNIIEDTIQDELDKIMGHHNAVYPGTVIPTKSGDLEKTHNVKKIFHAASVTGQVGRGYSPIFDLSRCVIQALELSKDFPELKSIIIPFMGTGKEKSDYETTIPLLIETAINYLYENPSCTLDKVYFLSIVKSKIDIAKHTFEKLLRS